MLNTAISFFNDLKSPPTTITLKKWIDLNTKFNPFTELVINYRKSKNLQLKKSLPFATVGGAFKNGRKLSDLQKPTGWLAIDIDHKDNTHLPSAEIIRDQIANISYVAFSCLSVSGEGVWALIKVQDPSSQAKYFEQLKVDFDHLKITLDPTKGKNAYDMRFLSFDPEAILKNRFDIYNRTPDQKIVNSKRTGNNFRTSVGIAFIVDQISKNRIDIAPDYITYRNIGFAFASEYGESGRAVFHDVVCYSPKYNFKEADFQYTMCLKSKGSGITFATFIHYCKINGIEVRR